MARSRAAGEERGTKEGGGRREDTNLYAAFKKVGGTAAMPHPGELHPPQRGGDRGTPPPPAK
ncbi:hypothetical protein BDY21DRAFT_350438 [Lineolata rhizophorae]|uniref:Uncharacterized protein n=1 Tax=Lineolata rhizophorae TaxID=578093 RepID=A0A6A6NVN7_9PEZI|nr:hypothetical protein BDY21DRAFT_350438 [Lineolata rhizophorae]